MYQLSQDCNLSISAQFTTMGVILFLPVLPGRMITRQHHWDNLPEFTLSHLPGNYQGIALGKQIWPKNNYRVMGKNQIFQMDGKGSSLIS
jgi:hypothetical protein